MVENLKQLVPIGSIDLLQFHVLARKSWTGSIGKVISFFLKPEVSDV